MMACYLQKNPEKCCNIPVLLSADDLSDCGIKKSSDDEPPMRGPPDVREC